MRAECALEGGDTGRGLGDTLGGLLGEAPPRRHQQAETPTKKESHEADLKEQCQDRGTGVHRP